MSHQTNSHERLTSAERETMTMLSMGFDAHGIAETLGLSPKTVQKRLLLIQEKLYVDSIEAALAKFKEAA